jgi:hypothetical protein
MAPLQSLQDNIEWFRHQRFQTESFRLGARKVLWLAESTENFDY